MKVFCLVRSSRLGLSCADEGRRGACPRVKRAVPTVLWGGWVVIGGGGAGCALPARVGVERGGSEGFEPGEQLAQRAVVVDPGLVVLVLLGAEPAADGAGGDLAGPLPVRAVQPGRVGVAAAVAVAAAGAPLGERAGQDHARGGDGRELGGDLAGLILVAGGGGHGLRGA